jgi:ABC-type bacteriocin/lantibiotic exporter with double-glycine peptidase domain
MDKNELDATVLASRLGVDSKVLGESILLTGKRRDALLNSLITPKQQLPSDVADLMGHRERRTAMTTMALGMLVAQDQDPALTATLLAPWRIPAAPAVVPQAPVPPKQVAPPMATPPPTAAPFTPPAPAATAPPAPKVPPQAAPRPGLLQRLRKRRVPVINQMGAVECGAACLAMILSYYGRKTSVSEVRDYCGVGRDGLSALNIVKAARSYGLRVRAVSLKENDFRYVTLPAIVHWEFNHFLIVERWTPKYVDLVILLVTSPLFAALAVAIGLVQVILLVTTNRLIRDLARRELLAQDKSQGYAAEALAGIATLKSAGAEQRSLQQWTNLFFDQMNASVRRSYVSSLINTAMSTLRTFSPLALLVVGTVLALNGTLQVGTMLALNALAIAFLTPVTSLVNSGQQLQLVHSHLERIADVMEAEPEQDVQTVKQPPRLTGHIRLDRVNFQYDPNSPPVLQDISVNIAPGQKVAVVGRSGSGKSTLGNLLLGMYLPTKGEIIYDGIPLRTLNYQAVRSQFVVVVQGSSVFNGSIRENIALNDPSMDMARIIKAAKMAAIHDDIMQMPMEYETFVSEGGSALSGGQRQRLALARALATTPVILLLDEATSALDVVTEQAIEQNLRSLPCTQIIIAHRLSTIRNADVILVIDQGMIVERGSHQELLQRTGYYARLIQSQLASGEIKAV